MNNSVSNLRLKSLKTGLYCGDLAHIFYTFFAAIFLPVTKQRPMTSVLLYRANQNAYFRKSAGGI
ncbi:MAG: hypothetical protein CK532_03185 [Flavobacteriales bacterium]|nr:MAG: hypothetical protein CK532_03185 [Flavobacteriales bacterium]